ncbi:MAG: hypothetical protein HUJ76_04185 [Parasporobacterium sp.]|nr:hypothetical protein [Parasporobacterium sp.]
MAKKRKRIRQPQIGSPKMRAIVLIFFAALIIVADIILLFSHSKSFSETENRVLQQAPELTMNSLISGKFMTQEEDFVTDQFFMRDAWISLKLLADRLSGKAESNNVYLGKEGYLIEKPVVPSEEYLTRNLQAINAFADRYSEVNTVMTLVPPVAWVCDQLLPDNAPCENVDAIMASVKSGLSDNVDFVDITAALKEHKTEPLYFKTDHHWKSLGAKYAFDVLASHLDVTPVDDYSVMTVTTDFAGTMASNSGDTSQRDSIEIYVPLTGNAEALQGSQSERALASDLEYVVEYTDAGETVKTATIYNSAALSQKDKYQVFLGGNHPLINIKTSADNGRNLLMLKDSYANTFLQFLLPYYQTITIVDPRYYSDDIYKLMSDRGITDVLILYCENYFITDNSLFGVLEFEV